MFTPPFSCSTSRLLKMLSRIAYTLVLSRSARRVVSKQYVLKQCRHCCQPHTHLHTTHLLVCIWAFNPFPHIDALWRLCNRQLFENIMTKEEIAQNEQFLLLPRYFPLLVIGYPFNYRDFLFFEGKCFSNKQQICSRSLKNKLVLANFKTIFLKISIKEK